MRFLVYLSLAVLVCGCIGGETDEGETVAPHIVSLGTDKKVYRSHEKMNITVDLKSGRQIQNASLHVYGIHSNYNRLDAILPLNLTAGADTVEFQYTTPSCFGCAGIRAGAYNVSVELVVDGVVVGNQTVEIEMKK